MSDLPEGWSEQPLADVAFLKTGPFGSALKKSDYVHDGIPVVNPMHIADGAIYPSPHMTISDDTARRLSEFLLSEGDVVMGRRGEMGRCAVVTTKEDGWLCGSGSFIVRPKKAVDPRYLQRFLSSPEVIETLTRSSVGSTMVNLNQQIMKSLSIPLPPLAEQKRIADKLDALLARVDACRARLGRVSALLKRFRQAVLAAAVAGRLTEDWRRENPELVSSDQLIDRLSQRISKNGQSQLRLSDGERFSASDLPPGWQFVSVGLVGDVYLGRQRSPENHNGPYMRPYVRAANITWQGWDLSDVKEMNFDPKDFARYKLQVGDVLINEGSGSADEVGKPAIWKGDIENCCFQNTLICVRPHEEMSDFLYYVFLHAAMSKSFVEDTRGVNIFHIGKDRFSAYSIPLPSLPEQHEIVRRVETLFAYADRLEARLAAAQARVAQLTPSLLAKAFAGMLNAE